MLCFFDLCIIAGQNRFQTVYRGIVGKKNSRTNALRRSRNIIQFYHVPRF